MKIPLAIVGAGEHARAVIDAALACGERFELLGYLAPSESAATSQRFGVAWLGDDDAPLPPGAQLVLGVGAREPSPRRRELVDRIAQSRPAVQWAAVIHPRAAVSASASVAAGAVVLASAVVNTGATVGAHAVVNSGALVEHDVVVEPFALVAPGAAIGGAARIGAGAYVGLGSRVRDHVTVGKDAMVGMGAVVVADVADGSVVVGVPARARR